MKTIRGLHLWMVNVEYSDEFGGRSSVGLWITTPKGSLERAIRKAHTFLRGTVARYPSPRIVSTKHHGTIDC